MLEHQWTRQFFHDQSIRLTHDKRTRLNNQPRKVSDWTFVYSCKKHQETMLERLTVWCGEQSWLNNPSINVGHTQPLMAKALLGSNVFSKMARPLRRFLAGGDRCCRGFGFSIICQCTWMPNWVLHKSLDHHHPKNPSNSNIIQYPQGCPFPRHECLPLHLVKGALESRAIMWDLLGFPHDHLSSTCSSESAVGHCHDTWLGPKSDEEWRNISAFVDLKFGSASLANRKIKYIYIYIPSFT